MLAGALLAALTGCAMYRGSGSPTAGPWPLLSAASPLTASVVVTGEMSANDLPREASYLTAEWRPLVVAEVLGAGIFTSVADGEAPADLLFEVHVVQRERYDGAAAAMTGATFFVLPCSFDEEFVMRTTVRDRTGNLLGTYVESESAVMWLQILLLFALPFHEPRVEQHALMRELTRATLADADAGGLFRPPLREGER